MAILPRDDGFQPVAQLFQLLTEQRNSLVQIGLFAIVLQFHGAQHFLVLSFAEFDLIAQFHNAAAQLPDFLVRSRNGLLDVLALFELNLLEFFAESDDRFLELS